MTMAPESEDFYELYPAVGRVSLNLAGDDSHSMLKGYATVFKRIWGVRRLITKLRPNVVIGMMSDAGIITVLAGIGLRCRVIVAERTHPPRLPLSRIMEKLRQKAYGHADAVVALTRESAVWLHQNTDAKNVKVIPNSVNWPIPACSPRFRSGSTGFSSQTGASRRGTP